jgi:hypothetical protein
MTDQQLNELLRTALPPTDDGASARDVWPRLSLRLDGATEWSYVDLGLAAAAAVALLIFPEWLWLLAYHL